MLDKQHKNKSKMSSCNVLKDYHPLHDHNRLLSTKLHTHQIEPQILDTCKLNILTMEDTEGNCSFQCNCNKYYVTFYPSERRNWYQLSGAHVVKYNVLLH